MKEYTKEFKHDGKDLKVIIKDNITKLPHDTKKTHIQIMDGNDIWGEVYMRMSINPDKINNLLDEVIYKADEIKGMSL